MQILYTVSIGLVSAGVIAVIVGMFFTLFTMIKRKDTARDRTKMGSYLILGGLALAILATTVLLAIAPQLR
ncbi:MAG: hypothetical protein ACSW8H_07640 [bacterium]